MKFNHKNAIITAENRCEALEKLYGSTLQDYVEPASTYEDIKITNIVNKLARVRSNGTIAKNNLKYVIIHHEGVKRPLWYNSLTRYQGQANYHVKAGFGHIAYNYSIDNVGEIFLMSPEGEIGYHAGNYAINRQSIAIKLDGDLTTQKMTTKQWKAYQNLARWLTTQRPDIPNILKKSFYRHGDVRLNGGTACPGTIDIKNF